MRTCRTLMALIVLLASSAFVQSQRRNDPTVKETLRWMQTSLESGAGTYAVGHELRSVRLEEFVGCRVHFSYSTHQEPFANGEPAPNKAPYRVDSFFGLGDIDPTSITFSKGPRDRLEGHSLMWIRTRNDEKKITTRFPGQSGVNERPDDTALVFTLDSIDNDYVVRFAKAFKHAVEACGGKPSLFANSNKEDSDGRASPVATVVGAQSTQPRKNIPEIEMEDANAHYNRGVLLHKKAGYLDEAVAEYREALRLKPDFVEAHVNLGSALSDKGDLDGAIAEYREVLRLQPDDYLAHNGFGIALFGKDDLDAAIAEYHEALRLKPDLVQAHVNLGIALSRKGNLDAAIAEYREALRLEPDFVKAHLNLGNALSDKGDLDAAIAEYREGLRLNPDDPAAHSSIGSALRDKGDLDAAIVEYHKALDLKPSYFNAHYGLGILLIKKGDLDGAIIESREALRLKPNDPAAHIGFATALLAKSDLDGAIAEYREALRLKPDSFSAHYNLGVVLTKKSDMDGAIAEYREALRLEPNDPKARSELTKLLAGKETAGVKDGAKGAGRLMADPAHTEYLAEQITTIILKATLALGGLYFVFRKKKPPK